METMEQSEQNVVLQLNGVAIDVDIIAKDAEIEMNNNNNNNDAVKPGEKMPIREETPEKMPEPATDVTETVKSPNESSLNMDNGNEKSALNTLAEGDSKVDEAVSNTAAESNDEMKYETSETLDSSSEDSEEQPTHGMESSGMSEILAEKSTKSDANETVSSDLTEGNNESTVTATDINDCLQRDKATDSDGNETVNESDSSKKSPQTKESNKKRKNRTRSQKKQVDYSKMTKYTVNISQRQRRYHLVMTRGRDIPAPSDDCEIFCSNIPINVLEGELVPLFERYGKIWELRLMMSMRNPKRNAGFAFVRFTSNESANEATEKLNNYEILPGKHLAIRLSEPNLSLFVGNIHRGLTREQIHEKISNRTTGLMKTFVKSSLYEDTKNCGFCFLEYDCHSAALQAKRLLNKGNVWGRQLFVDWAQRRKQPEDGDLSESKTLFINNLPKELTEEQINENLGTFGTIEKVTKIKDYAFVLFAEHEAAIEAMNSADKEKLGSDKIEVSMAMPKSLKNRPQRHSPFMAYHQNDHSHRNNHSFNHFRSTHRGSSNKFYMRKPNDNKSDNDEATEQTQVPMPSEVGQTQIPTPNPLDSAPAEAFVN